ncbi:MAG: RNA 2',3'-cyclic phosphodiesterase [Candidatus Parvarchaeota archaeon]|nr:RNA 2',3'-cyclic phosphodiesterase [Candidatus Parvarchaeota archaeon]
MRRLFIALEIPEDKKDLLYEVSKALSKSVSGNFVDRDKMHVTIRFLGDPNIPDDRITGAVKEINGGFRREIDVRGVDSFYHGDTPSVMFFNVSTDLSDINSKLSALLGIEEDKRFYPHITICRLKGREGVEDARRKYKDFSLSFLSNGLTLFDSDFKSYRRITGPSAGS